GTSTVTFNGLGNQTLTSGSTSFFHVVINKTANTLALADALDVDGNFTLTAGTLDTGSNALSFGGNFSHNGGTFSGTNSTATFNGSTVSTLTGATTFYGLRDITVGATLQFAPATTFYVTSMIDLKNISLKSSGANGTTWYFKYAGSSQTL